MVTVESNDKRIHYVNPPPPPSHVGVLRWNVKPPLGSNISVPPPGFRRAQQPANRRMAAIPAGGSLVATTDYYRSESRGSVCPDAAFNGRNGGGSVTASSSSPQGASAPRPAAALVAVRSTAGRSSLTTQVGRGFQHGRLWIGTRLPPRSFIRVLG